MSTREPLRELTGALAKRSRVVGRGRTGRLGDRGVLRVKLTRTLARGTYTLGVRAVRANGSRARLNVKIRVS